MMMLVKIIVILVIPTFFFSYIGHDPMREVINKNARSIAIVNEDIGYEFEKNSLTLGKDVSEILGKDSSYNWITVNRSTAESGLNNGRYDAVVYLPSDFTKNVLSFTDDRPIESTVTYEIQPNVNAERAEKVQKEMEAAKNKINTNMSTIYWSYVSQSVDDIRKKFDGILEKEVAFQGTMYDFYTPSSQFLTAEIGNQKQLLEGILSTASSTSQATGESLTSSSGNKAEIERFISDINAFKEYQLNQEMLIEQISAENHKLLNDSIEEYDSVIKEGVSTITAQTPTDFTNNKEDGKKLQKDVSNIQKQLETSSKTLKELSETIGSSNAQEQFERLLELQKDNMKSYKARSSDLRLDSIQMAIINSRNDLLRSSAPVGGATASISSMDIATVDVSGMKNQIEQLKTIAATLKDTNPTAFEQLNASIIAFEDTMLSIDQQVEKQKSQQQQWKTAAKENNTKVTENQQNIISEIVEKINQKEQQMLLLDGLTEERKQVFHAIFSNKIVSNNVDDLLSYYFNLSQFEGELTHKNTVDDTLIEQIIRKGEDQAIIQEAFDRVKAETQLFYQLQGTIDESAKNASHLEGDFYKYTNGILDLIDNYETQFKKYHTDVLSNLSTMETNVARVSENLTQKTTAPTFELAPGSETNGEFMLQIQDQSFGALQVISQMVNSIAEQQDSITSNTSDLYSKVSTVQQQVDDLNDKWAQNVQTTKQVKGDVYGILNNTLVDKQENPFMYHFLSNPVKLSGDKFQEKVTPTPPVIMLIIVLISGVLIGLFLHHYSELNKLLHILLNLLVTVTVGLIISMYGLKMYPMHDVQAVKWTVFTVILLWSIVSLVRLAFFIGSFVGSLITILLVAFFTMPILDLILPNFSMEHPISTLYLNIQLGNSDGFILIVSILLIVSIISSLIPYLKGKDLDLSEEATHEA